MKTQIHRLRTRIAELHAQGDSPTLDALDLMLDGFDEIDQQIGEFDEETVTLLRTVEPTEDEDEELEESPWGERFGKVVEIVEQTLNRVVRAL